MQLRHQGLEGNRNPAPEPTRGGASAVFFLSASSCACTFSTSSLALTASFCQPPIVPSPVLRAEARSEN